MLPTPAGTQVAPPVPTHVHVTPSRLGGNVSLTVAPVTLLGPTFVATIV